MRAKRAAILTSLLVSFAATVWLGFGILDSDSSDVVYADGQSSRGVDPGLTNDARTQPNIETRSGSVVSLFGSLGALASLCVFIVSTILFRLEVRSEKAAGRARRQRMSYYKDLRRYKAQLQGPPRDNT